MKKILATAIFLIIGFVSINAYAQRKNPLDGQPAVRRRLMFLPQRFEVTPHLGLTYLQDFKHAFMVGVRAEYHILEWLSIGVFFDYAVVNWDTQLTNAIEETLPDNLNPNTLVDPSPSKKIMKDALNSLMFKAGVYMAYTPWFGKLSLFGKVFAKFDVHFLAGAGFVMLKAGTMNQVDGACNGDIDPDGRCSSALYIDRRVDNGGFKVGPLVGFGLRFWALKWLSVSFTMHMIFFKQNSAGFDKTGDTITGTDVLIVDAKDESWSNLMSFHIGVSFFFPMNAPRSK